MFVTINSENCVYLKSDFLFSPHGFATRVGGVSRLSDTRGLNLAFGRGDDRETVLENLRIFSAAVGVDPHSVISLPQIHSDLVMDVEKEDGGRGYFTDADGECDGYITDAIGVTLGVKTADCVPILLEARDSENRVVTVAALHAGWRGTYSEIVVRALENMRRRGIDPKRVFAAIGAAVCPDCYEVDEHFYRLFEEKFPTAPLNRFFPQQAPYHADLKEVNRWLLIGAGVPEENIDVCQLCTCCRQDLFFSHRYATAHGIGRGTRLSVISIA